MVALERGDEFDPEFISKLPLSRNISGAEQPICFQAMDDVAQWLHYKNSDDYNEACNDGTVTEQINQIFGGEKNV